MAHVLIVEDEADIRQVLEYNLGQAGHEVRVAGTAAEAHEALRQRA